jgi:hypothetical protein
MKIARSHIFAVIAIIAILLAAWYVIRVISSSDPCASADPDEQAACCANANKDQITVACMGEWEFDKKLQQCSYVCNLDQEIRFCTQDVFECPDGSFVSRDTKNNCEFRPCP